MSETLSKGEVLVTLSCSEPASITFPQRRVLLTSKKRTVPVGRASKSSVSLEPRMYNSWIDSPVMSRKHAELQLHTDGQTVFLRDVGSLHGTYHNGTQLRNGQSQALSDGDELKFGIAIDRKKDSFPPCTMKVAMQFPNSAEDDLMQLQPIRPVTFQVPEDTDSEDLESEAAFSSIDENDEDDDEIGEALSSSVAALVKNGLELAEFHGFENSDPIDLTSEPDLVSENNMLSSSNLASETSDVDAHPVDYTVGTINLSDEDLPSLAEDSALRTENFAPASHYKEQLHLEIKDDQLPPPGAFPDEQHSPTINIAASIRRAEILGEISGKRDFFAAREHNRTIAQSGGAALSKEPTEPASNNVILEPEQAEIRAAAENLNTTTQDATITPVEADKSGIASPRVSLKRKADNISGSETNEFHQGETTANATFVSPMDGVSREMHNISVSKRIRTAAEVFGYAAIGGAAVMTALIATAPTF